MAVVTCVHHHASLSVTFDALRLAERPGYCLVSIPCCFADDVDPGWDLVLAGVVSGEVAERPPLEPFEPIKVAGGTLSDTIRNERQDRF